MRVQRMPGSKHANKLRLGKLKYQEDSARAQMRRERRMWALIVELWAAHMEADRLGLPRESVEGLAA